MKKFMITLIGIGVMVAGCGENPKETKFKGVEQKHDYVTEGMEYLSDADVPMAIHSFDKAIKQDPTNPDNYLVLGQVYLRLRQVDRAIDTFSAATRVDPDNGDAYYLLATSRALDGQRPKAVEAAQRCVEIYMQQRDEEKFKRAVALLKSLTEQPAAADAPATQTTTTTPTVTQ